MSEEYKAMTLEDVLGADFSEHVIQGVKQLEVLTLESYQKQLQELNKEISKVARAHARAKYSEDDRDDEMYELEARDAELGSLIVELEEAWLARVKELEAREQELLKLKEPQYAIFTSYSEDSNPLDSYLGDTSNLEDAESRILFEAQPKEAGFEWLPDGNNWILAAVMFKGTSNEFLVVAGAAARIFDLRPVTEAEVMEAVR